jgi:hypothetical protein
MKIDFPPKKTCVRPRDTREDRQEQRQERNKPGQKVRRTMTMANFGPNQIRPIGTWVKYAHALLQTNEAIFIY